jgi:hypothetical protein
MIFYVDVNLGFDVAEVCKLIVLGVKYCGRGLD